jgi:hypothetical protein
MKGGLWARKFDYKNGEDRVCNKCNTPFHTKKPSWKCSKCFNEEQKVIQGKIRKEKGLKANYPFSTVTNEAGKRFSKIRVELNKVWRTGDRDLIRGHYAHQLKEAERLGIIAWINDVRTKEVAEERSMRSKEQTKKDYPDTRGHYEY